MYYEDLVEFLGEHKRTIKDIEFIQSYSYDDEGNIYEFEIEKKDFIKVIKEIESIDGSETLKIVGKDWWIATDTDEGFFEMYELPIRPMKKINLAKELLIEPERKPSFILGIEFNEDE